MNHLNTDMQIRRQRNGITLAHPNHALSGHSVSDLFSLPLQFYFYDIEQAFCNVNETAAQTNGFLSEKDAIGKTICHTVTKESAARIVANNKTILQSQSMQILEESIQRKDDIFLQGISIKFPWYQNMKLKGIFGCSFVIDSLQSYARNLDLIAKTGLLSFPLSSEKKIQDTNYFSKREQDILFFLVRGKTAKEIAATLGLSRRTVEHYLENLKIKTRSATKSELIEKVFCFFQ